MSTTLLVKRLRTLERDGVVSSVVAPSGRGRRYYLTPQGQELAEVVLHLGTWGARWLEVTPREQDPFIALWSWTRMVDVEALPPHRVVVRFDFHDRPREPFWLLLHRPRHLATPGRSRRRATLGAPPVRPSADAEGVGGAP